MHRRLLCEFGSLAEYRKKNHLSIEPFEEVFLDRIGEGLCRVGGIALAILLLALEVQGGDLLP